MKRMSSRGGVLVVIALFLIPPAFAGSAAAADEGAAIYKAKCNACHGATGAGDTPMGKKLKVKDLASPTAQKLTDEELFDLISKGKDKMPPFEKRLTPEKIRLVVAYIRTLTRS